MFSILDSANNAIVIPQLHRQLGCRHCRVHPSAQDEETCEDRSVLCPSTTTTSLHLNVHIGDRIVVVVQKQRNFGPESGPGGSVSTSAANKVRRGDMRHAVVVRTAKKLQRPDGSVVKFDDNACVLINKTGEPIGTRINGRLARHFDRRTAADVL